MLNTELFAIPLSEDRFLVYAPLRQAAFVGNTKMVNVIAALREGSSEDLDNSDSDVAGLLSRLRLLDGTPEVDPIVEFSGDPFPTNITLFLTTACNLRCTYCYASAGDTPTKRMPLEVAKRGIDFVIGNAMRSGSELIELNYHGGGEPTVNWDTLTRSYDYAFNLCAQHGLELVASTATNGVIASSRLEWIVDHLQGVSLSFDGLPEAHDRHRKTVSGGGSSNAVMNTLRFFDECDFSYGLRITVTKDQIPQLPQSVEYVCTNFNPQTIQVEPSYQLGRWRNSPSAETQNFIDAYRDGQTVARRLGYQISFSGARLGTLTNHFCGVTQDSFGLSASGAVSACYEVFDEETENADIFIYGQPSENGDGYTFDLKRLNRLRGQAVQHRDYCKGCFAKWSCGGDCYNKSIIASGSETFAGSDRCHIIRELTKDQILQAIADNGGVYWLGDSWWDLAPGDEDCSYCGHAEAAK